MTPTLVLSKTHEYASKQAHKSIVCIFRYQRSFGHFCHTDMFNFLIVWLSLYYAMGLKYWAANMSIE